MAFISDLPAQVVGATQIAFGPETLQNPASALAKEWLVTNSIGGYASGTLVNANTRRYHGLLIAALKPPTSRALLLSKLDETIRITSSALLPEPFPELLPDTQNEQSFPLSANLYPGTLYPQGYTHLVSWNSFPCPTWRWVLPGGVTLEKQIWMANGQNCTYISYRLVDSPAGHTVCLDLIPLLAWRDYHSHMFANEDRPEVHDHLVETGELRFTLPPIPRVTDVPTQLILGLSTQTSANFGSATFEPHPDWYYRFQHPREAERGLDHQEDLYTPGTLHCQLLPDNPLTITISSEIAPDKPQVAWERRLERQSRLLLPDSVSRPLPNQAMESGAPSAPQAEIPDTEHSSPDIASLLSKLALASDAFIVEVPGTRTSIIAGYPWFTDWGRDTMIALPGLCLSMDRFDIARQILVSFAAHVDQGMLPNRFPDIMKTIDTVNGGQTGGGQQEPLEYNTVDATLWFVVAIYRYVQSTGDFDSLQKIFWPVLREIVGWHQRGTRYNIHIDPADHLLAAGKEGVQLTWMDARVGDYVVTPRIGKPVEINALWYNVLRIMAHFAGTVDAEGVEPYRAEAEQVRSHFVAGFSRADGIGLYDVLPFPGSTDVPDTAIRPNQVFALSLPFPVVDPASELARQILFTVRDHLLTPCGLRTLSPNDPHFCARYGGGVWERDTSYHQGIVWPWLLGPYVEALYRVEGDRLAAIAALCTLSGQLDTYGIGNLAEIFDGTRPQRPNGCIAQAWSVAETLRVLKDLSRFTE